MKLTPSRATQTVLGLAGLILLLLLFNPAEIWRVLSGCDFAYVALSLALMTVVIVIRAHRWWMVSRGIGLPLPFPALLEITFISNFLNLFLPGSLGGDTYRAYSAARLSNRKLRPIAGVVIERVTGLVALMGICVIAAIISRRMLPFHPALLLGACGVVVAGIALTFWLLFRARPLYHRFRHLIPARLSAKLTPERWDVILDVVEDVSRRRNIFLMSLATGVLLQLVVLTTYYTTSLALGKNVPLYFFFVFFPLIELAGMIPLTINGLGIKEGFVVACLKIAGLTPSFSMGLAILNRVLATIVALAGGLLWLLRRNQSGIRPAGKSG